MKSEWGLNIVPIPCTSRPKRELKGKKNKKKKVLPRSVSSRPREAGCATDESGKRPAVAFSAHAEGQPDALGAGPERLTAEFSPKPCPPTKFQKARP